MYIVTGLYYNSNRRFSPIVCSNAQHANAINLWRGSVWQVVNGKRKLVKRVYN